jgi:hypothetical protein
MLHMRNYRRFAPWRSGIGRVPHARGRDRF